MPLFWCVFLCFLEVKIMFDVAIIGAGVVGSLIARRLSAYDIRICVLEKENDVAMGSTRANSAIVHAGFDAKEKSLKARFNVLGSEMMEQTAKELGVKYSRNGSLVIGFDEEDRKTLSELLARGNANGVRELRIIEGAELWQLEPKLSKNVICALYAPTGAIICPYELAIAAIGNAMDNGAELRLNFEVSGIEKKEGFWEIHSGNESIRAKFIINAAGIFSDKIAKMAGDDSFEIKPRRGEYILLDKECGSMLRTTVFRTPSKMGKGILVSPTVDGNLLLGPTSEDIEDKTDKKTTAEGFAKVIKEASENVDDLPMNKTITSFCGLRAVGSTGDFIINSPKENFINVAAIESPGLTSAPAIADYIAEMLSEMTELSEKETYDPTRKPMHWFRELTLDEKNEVIKSDGSYGKIICRCEEITEGEILEAIRTNPRPRDLDGVKRRTRSQMGRCQGGFCSPQIVEILARELNMSPLEVTKFGGESRINVGITKGDM